MLEAAAVPKSARCDGCVTVLACLLGLLLGATAHAGEARLVKDIERASYGCDTSRLLESAGALYFGTSYRCRFGGLGLWRTDGSHAGTSVVRSFARGPRDIDGVQTITSAGGLLYFGSHASSGGVVELWRSDGTTGGTVRLWGAGTDERIDSSFLSDLPVVGVLGSEVLFVVERGFEDSTLWITDGTPEGTRTLPDVADGWFRASYLVADGALFLLVYDGDTGYALWRTDGTDEGTEPVRQIGFAFGADLGDSIEVGPDGTIYFVIPSAPGVRTLWRSRGTTATTSPVLDLPFASYWVLAEGVHYVLEARRQAVRLWRFDPLELDLELLKLIDPVPVGDNDLDFLGSAAGVAYFTRFASAGYREQMWRSDGTPDGTFRIHDQVLAGGLGRTATGFAFQPLPSDGPSVLWHTDGSIAGTAPVFTTAGGAGFDDFTPIGDRAALFVAYRSPGIHLMRTDGTPAGTSSLVRLAGDVWNVGAIDGVGVLFAVSTLWRSDGTSAGTYRLLELGPSTMGSSPDELVGIDDTLLFAVGGVGDFANDLWRSDGKRAGTRRVRAFPDGQDGLRLLTPGGDGLAFARGASELWTSDGTAAGTVLLGDTATSGGGAHIEEILDLGGATFVAVRGTNPTEGALWRTDGSPAGTEVVAPLAPSHLASFAGALHFSAPRDDRVAALWRSDGSAAGTVPLATFSALNRRRRPEVGPLFAGDDAFFFSVARRGRTHLWRSDGTEAGTQRISLLPSVPGSTSKVVVSDGGYVGGRFVFGYPTAFLGTPGPNLWSSDGTAGGTVAIATLSPDGTPSGFVRVGERLLFLSPGTSPGGSFYGIFLWTTDGTEAGTELLADLDVAGTIAVAGDVAYFCARGTTGESERLWRTDGTVAGTEPAFDRVRWCRGKLATTSDRLFFTADTRRYGIELWSALLGPR